MFLRAVTTAVRRNRVGSCARVFCSAANVGVQRSTQNFYRHESSLVVEWNDKSVSRFPYVYLRDLCTCSKCMDSNSLTRLTDAATEVPLDIKPSNVTVLSDGETIQIQWPDNHVTLFDSVWLHGWKLLEKDEREQHNSSIARKGVNFWDRKSMHDKIPRFEFNRIIEEDESLFQWLRSLHSVGIALLENVPTYTDPPAVQTLCRRIGYIKSTHYGYIFDVFAKFDANNLAYTTAALPLHCDIPQSQYYPGLQLLHCLQQIAFEGGANMFVDGFHIAQEFKTQEPALFDLLSTATLPYWDVGVDDYGDFHLNYSRPVFELDYSGKITRFTYNNHARDYFLKGNPHKVQQIYKGYMKMGKMMRDPKNKIDYKMTAGEMMTFNNSRVLHGRTAYTPTETGNRHLQGNYLDWDLVYARLRSLGKSLGQPFEE